jgi:trimethylamine--corrinoid protein Co-methyltransferase
MKTLLRVLSDDERAQVHERTLSILNTTGVRVETDQGRRYLLEAGAEIYENTHVVRFPRRLVEESLRLTNKDFTLGARRPGWGLQMNGGDCTLLMDGEAVSVIDRETGERRPGTIHDWLQGTRLIDALDEIGVYWSMVEANDRSDSMGAYIGYLHDMFRNFSKHIQDAAASVQEAKWLLEVLQVIFGDRETIKAAHPMSYLLCPQSPLVIDRQYTDAYLTLKDWDIPLAVMPMPLMGGTAPGSLIGTIVLGNCEVLATLCLAQAAAPGTPVIYAPALSVMDPSTGRYSGGNVEHTLLGAAATEMARYYSLPALSTGFSTDHHVPSIQAGYERALNAVLPVLSWPDILVGPGLLGGAMILSYEQLLIDVEVFKMCKRAHAGITTQQDRWLADVIGDIGPGGCFIAERSTVNGIRGGEWYHTSFGMHVAFEEWEASGKPNLLEEARARVNHLLATHEPLTLPEDVEQELARIQERAAMDETSGSRQL